MPAHDDRHDVDETKATAHLPGLDIEILRRRSADGDKEQISIHLLATPSFEAVGRLLALANPFLFWSQAARLAWSSWSDAAQAMMPPARSVPALPPPRHEAKTASPSRKRTSAR